MQRNYINITKKASIALLVICFATFFLQACKKENRPPTPFPLETGEITTSADAVTINPDKPGDEAMTISWAAFPNTMIRYTLQLSYGGAEELVAVPAGAVSRRFNHGELNNIIVDKLGMEIGSESELELTLLAEIPSKNESAISKSIKVRVKPAPTGAAYSELWVVGDATPNGWDINNPNPMRKDPTNPFQFKFNAVLNVGDFKIPVSTGDWGTDFFMPLQNNPAITETTVQLTIGGNPDNKWRITEPGPYKILLNIGSEPFINIVAFTPYAQVWMVGDATPAGWNIDAPTPMIATPGNPYEFTYTGALSAGDFKIPVTTGNWSTDYFMPPVDGQGVDGTDAILIVGGNPDNKWKIVEAGNYKITLNQLYETISIVKQ